MIILKATVTNWGLTGPGDWEKIKWKVEENGWYQHKTCFRSGNGDIPEVPDLTTEGTLSADQLEQLNGLLSADWSQEKTEACDGEGWEFKAYENGVICKHREIGYIYGIEPYETIAGILRQCE